MIRAVRFRRRRGSGQIGSTLTGAMTRASIAAERDKGITAVIARRGTEHGSGLGMHRWVVEQSIALLHWFRRLRIRWEIRDDIREAFLSLACAIICWCRLRNLSLC